MRPHILLLTATLASIQTAAAYADCLSVIKGPIVLAPQSCTVVNPEATFAQAKPAFKAIRNMDATFRKKLYNSYRGLVLEGTVIRSLAKQQGMSEEKGALQGQSIKAFVATGTCATYQGRQVVGIIEEVCCNGGDTAPCLIDVTYKINRPEAKAAQPPAKQAMKRGTAKKSVDYAKAEEYFAKKQYADAIKLYEAAQARHELDPTGVYHLGASLREVDACPRAIPYLKLIYDKKIAGAVWADDDAVVRESNFLLARCYSRTSSQSEAMLILQSYLLEPKKHRKEITDSLNHPDFGFIHTSKDYIQYKNDAEKKLRGI